MHFTLLELGCQGRLGRLCNPCGPNPKRACFVKQKTALWFAVLRGLPLMLLRGLIVCVFSAASAVISIFFTPNTLNPLVYNLLHFVSHHITYHSIAYSTKISITYFLLRCVVFLAIALSSFVSILSSPLRRRGGKSFVKPFLQGVLLYAIMKK